MSGRQALLFELRRTKFVEQSFGLFPCTKRDPLRDPFIQVAARQRDEVSVELKRALTSGANPPIVFLAEKFDA